MWPLDGAVGCVHERDKPTAKTVVEIKNAVVQRAGLDAGGG